MIQIYVATYNNADLVDGAIKCLEKHILDHDYQIKILCGISYKNLFDHTGYETIETKFLAPNLRRMGYSHLLNNQYDDLIIYIDDDIRLIKNVHIRDRYNSQYFYKTPHCSMVQIWQGCLGDKCKNTQCKILKTIRLSNNKRHSWHDDTKLMELAINNKSELVDNAWLHIDKGSEKMTNTRLLLLNYLNHKYVS